MTSQEPVSSLIEKLRLGIEAARANQFKKARTFLIEVLMQNPNHIPALLWAAFVAPTPHESIKLLNRVLSLDPASERARAGLRWAEQRLSAVAALTEPDEESGQAAANQADPSLSSDELTRQQILSKPDVHQRAKKSALAHRARRTIDPFMIALIMIGAGAMLGFGLWALAFGPPETLAAWLPAPLETNNSRADLASLMTPIKIDPTSEASVPIAKSYNFKADTIFVKPVQPIAAPVEPLTPLPASETVTSAPLDETDPSVPEREPIVSQPVELIGPAEETLNGLRLFQPVPKSSLAHQPVSPKEKWIEVNVTNQQVTAWEGNTPVLSFTASTGLPGTPTVLGEYNIYWKLKSTLMAGPGYYLPEVPYTMYFYAGYALHGAYWHNNFGQPMSHGCVNLSIEDSKILFEWADPVMPPGQSQVVSSVDNPGTLVVVHD